MHSLELIEQVTDVLNYVYDQKEKLGGEEMVKQYAQNVYEILRGLNDNESIYDQYVFLMDEALQMETFDFNSFYVNASRFLIKLYNSDIKEYKENQGKLKKEYVSGVSTLTGSFDSWTEILRTYNNKYKQDKGENFGKGVVYSAITGEYDKIDEPGDFETKLDYVLFVDEYPQNYSGKWQIRKIENPLGLSDRRLARWVKMHPFDLLPEYDFSIWVDGKLHIQRDLEDYVRMFKKNSGMICFPHYESKTLNDQIDAIVSNKKADRGELEKQLNEYLKAGYHEKGFITETGCIVRNHHDDKLRKVMDDWWKELSSHGHDRDQMSFDYVCWKNGYDFDICNLLIYHNLWTSAVAVH